MINFKKKKIIMNNQIKLFNNILFHTSSILYLYSSSNYLPSPNIKHLLSSIVSLSQIP